MALYSPDWTNIGFSLRLLTVNLFRHPTLIEHGLYPVEYTKDSMIIKEGDVGSLVLLWKVS